MEPNKYHKAVLDCLMAQGDCNKYAAVLLNSHHWDDFRVDTRSAMFDPITKIDLITISNEAKERGIIATGYMFGLLVIVERKGPSAPVFLSDAEAAKFFADIGSTGEGLLKPKLRDLIVDPHFDAAYWYIKAKRQGSENALITDEGNGTTAQQTQVMARINGPFKIPVQPGKNYGLSSITQASRGFTGMLRLVVDWYDKNSIALDTQSIVNGTDFRSTPSVANITDNIEGKISAPQNARYAIPSIMNCWSTTLNNNGYASVGSMHFVQA